MKILPATSADLARIVAAAAADKHAVCFPTHFAENDRGEVIGYFSVDAICNVNFWSHSANNKFESIRLMKVSQALALATGKPPVYYCTAESPFTPVMPSLGFKLAGVLRGDTNVFFLNEK